MRRLLKFFTVPTLPKKYQPWLKRNWWWLLIGLTAFTVAFLAFVLDNWWPRTGFNGKTLWEWLELLGVPLTLAILGYFLQQQEQKRAREDAKDEILERFPDAKIDCIVLDNMDLSTVHSFAETFNQKYNRLDYLLNNAGIMATPDEATKDGYDTQMQTNHFSHFLLVGPPTLCILLFPQFGCCFLLLLRLPILPIHV